MTLRILAMIAMLSAAVSAQTLNYPDFSSIAGLTLNGSALQHNGLRLGLHPSATDVKGSVFHDQPLAVVRGFDTTFTFVINVGLSGGADGMAFVIHNDPRGDTMLGEDGSNIGYGGSQAVVNALVVEIDTFSGGNGTAYGDSSDNEISVHTGGSGPCTVSEGLSLGQATPVANLSDGSPHTMRVLYVPGLLEIYLDGAATPELSIPFDFQLGGSYVVVPGPAAPPILMLDEFAWVGFTGATGQSTELHRVDSWTWTSAGSILKWTGGVSAGAGGPFDVLGVNGSAGGPGRTVIVPVGATFSLDMMQPPFNGLPSGIYLAAMLGYPDPTWNATVLTLGPTVFPFPTPFSTPLFHVLVDTFGFSFPTLYGTPTPWSFSVPGGFPMPYRFTMQGIVEETPGVAAITNAVRIDIQ